MDILVTGGLGFIGSHTVVELLKGDNKVYIVDNLYNSNIEVLTAIKRITKKEPIYFNFDVTNQYSMDMIFKKSHIDAIIHFAGYKAVFESIQEPIKYYYNNILSTLVLLDLCEKYSVKNFIFSSSATVYGDQKYPVDEECETGNATNPYGETKLINEKILKDYSKASPNFSVKLLRYFNPIGAHSSGLIGEDPKGIPNNLMPYICKVANGELPYLNIFGNDYDTNDGTCIRDFVHVNDIARGHIQALNIKNGGVFTYNLGTGKGTSVLELVNQFMETNKINIPYKFAARREGDLPVVYAKADKAKRELAWEAEYDLNDMVKDSWNYYKNRQSGKL